MSPFELRSARVRLNMTQGQLALSLGWSSGSGSRHIRRFEKGEAPIPPHVADRVRNLEPEEA